MPNALTTVEDGFAKLQATGTSIPFYLSDPLRAQLEACFDCDLSGIKIHVSLSEWEGAPLGWTSQDHVFLSGQACRSPSSVFTHVLAHEIAHAAQHRAGRVPRGVVGAGAILADCALEAEANEWADRAVEHLRRLGVEATAADALKAAPADRGGVALSASAGPILCYPLVVGQPNLPQNAADWLKRFRYHGRKEPSIEFILNQLERLQKTFESESDLVAIVRILAGANAGIPRPKPTRIGIPYRDDGRGNAILEDVRLVARAVQDCGRGGCEVVVLVPYQQLDKFVELDKMGVRARVCYAPTTLGMLKIDALYISGGPNDHPGTTGEGRSRAAKGERIDVADLRHRFETNLIREALKRNLPILGICGGSWRLGFELGAEIHRLESEERRHAGNMQKPQVAMHTVEVKPISMLGQILATDNYRAGTKWPNQERYEGDSLPELPVNSVHWAHSVFKRMTGVEVSAVDGDTTEAFEDPSLHFCLGIQWHPEYAQLGLDDHGEIISRIHARPLRALAHAAEDGRAARVIQAQFRKTHKK